MPLHKSEPASQFDLFSARPEPPRRPVPARPPPEPENDKPAQPARPKRIPAINPLPPAADEWWTTRMTCAFQKISRKTLWERRKDERLGFPQPVQLGGSVVFVNLSIRGRGAQVNRLAVLILKHFPDEFVEFERGDHRRSARLQLRGDEPAGPGQPLKKGSGKVIADTLRQISHSQVAHRDLCVRGCTLKAATDPETTPENALA